LPCQTLVPQAFAAMSGASQGSSIDSSAAVAVVAAVAGRLEGHRLGRLLRLQSSHLHPQVCPEPENSHSTGPLEAAAGTAAAAAAAVQGTVVAHTVQLNEVLGSGSRV